MLSVTLQSLPCPNTHTNTLLAIHPRILNLVENIFAFWNIKVLFPPRAFIILFTISAGLYPKYHVVSEDTNKSNHTTLVSLYCTALEDVPKNFGNQLSVLIL